MKKLLALISLVAFLGSAFPAFATSYPTGAAQAYLAGSGINSTQTTISLTAFKTPDGRAISMSSIGTVGYATIDPQSTSKTEEVSFTGITQNGNGTAILTGVTRGLDFLYPYSSTASLAYSHSGGSTLIISNTPQFYYNEFAMQNNANVNTWPFASTSPATKGYVDYVAFNGAAVINANTTNKGIVQIATPAQIAASTANGSTGATLVIPSSSATSTWSSSIPIGTVPSIGSLGGTIDPNFISPITNVQTFTNTNTPGTWTKPSNVTSVQVILIGGGASGSPGVGSCNYINPSTSGAYIESTIPASFLPSTMTVTVGSGGNWVNTSLGVMGSSTSFGNFLVARGGVPNVAASTTPPSTTMAYQLGGAAQSRTASTPGDNSPFNFNLLGGVVGTNGPTNGGNGASATTSMPILGGAGGAGFTNQTGGQTGTNGGNGGLYGAAGGDGGCSSTAATTTPGNGAQGIAVITSYK